MIGYPIEGVVGNAHVTLLANGGGEKGTGRDPTAERGSPGAKGATGREIWRWGSVISAVCGPIGGGEMDSHGCNVLGDTQITPWVEGGTISQLECRGGGLDCAGRTVRRADRSIRSRGRAISGEGQNSHERYVCRVESGNGKPNGGPENGPKKINTFHLWGGKDLGGLSLSRGTGREVPEMGHPIWKLSFLTHRAMSSRYPVSQMNTPPKSVSVLW